MDATTNSTRSCVPFSNEATKYEKLAKIGQGTYSVVWKARHRETNTVVALKKLTMENKTGGFLITAMREIKILKQLNHNNIVKLMEICSSKSNDTRDNYCLVLEFCEHDLAGLLRNAGVQFSLGEKKMVIKQLFEGLLFIHSKGFMHRDLKPANILITRKGVLKLADFGLARSHKVRTNSKPNRYTNPVMTLWYRSPEILLGERDYGTSVDMWGAGCIVAEFWTHSPILQGTIEQHQLDLISRLCGSITNDSFPGFHLLPVPSVMELPKGHKRKLKERLQVVIKDIKALELVDKLLTLNPMGRLNSEEALHHDFLCSYPLPCDLGKLMAKQTESMYSYSCSSKNLLKHQLPKPGPSSAVKRPADDDQYCDRIF